MTVPTRTSLVLPRKGLGEAFGTGFQKGLEDGLAGGMKQFLLGGQQRKAAALKQDEAVKKSADDFGTLLKKKAKENNVGDQFDDMSPMDIFMANQEGKQRILAGEDPESVATSIVVSKSEALQKAYAQKETANDFGNFLKGEAEKEQPQEEKQPRERKKGPAEEGSTLIGDIKNLSPKFQRGTRQGAMGSIMGQQLTPEELLKKSQEDPTFAESIAETTGSLVSDAPFFAVGAGLGILSGSPSIGVQASLTLPTLVRSTADEVWKHVRDEDKFTMQKGGESAMKVARDVAKSSMTASALGAVPMLKEAIDKIPGAKKLFENRFTQMLLDKGLEVGTLGTASAAVEGRLPTKKDYVDAIGTVAAFEIAKLPGKLGSKIQTKAMESGFTPKVFAGKVKEGLSKAKVSVEDVKANKPDAIRKLNRVVNDITKEGQSAEAKKAKKVGEEAPKAEIGKEQLKKEGVAEKTLVKKAAKSPVEEIFKEEKPVKHREETILKKEAQVADVEERIAPLRKEMLKASKEQMDLELNRRRAKSPAEKAKIQEDINRVRFLREEMARDMKTLQSEKVQGKRPQTREEISTQIDTAFDKIRSEIKNPEKVDSKLVEKRAVADKKAIDLANKLSKRGKLLSDGEADTFIKIKEQYSKAYKDLIKSNKELANNLAEKKGLKAKKEIAEIEQMNKILEHRMKRAKADIVKQKDKKAIQKLTKGARGAFFKKELGKLRGDVEAFQKSFFKHKKLRSISERKTELTARKGVEELQKAPKEELARKTISKKAFNELKKNPTEDNARKAAESEGLDYEEVKTDAKKTVEEVTSEGVSEATKRSKIKEFINKWAKKKGTGPALTALNGILKATTGFSLPISVLRSGLSKLKGSKTASMASTVLVYKMVGFLSKKTKETLDDSRAKKYKAISDIALKQKYIKDLKAKGISTKRINKIRAASRAA